MKIRDIVAIMPFSSRVAINFTKEERIENPLSIAPIVYRRLFEFYGQASELTDEWLEKEVVLVCPGNDEQFNDKGRLFNVPCLEIVTAHNL